jgi:O-Antigen ligase
VINTHQISIPRIQPLARTKLARYPKTQKFKLPILLTILHIPLGLLLYRSSVLAMMHPLAVLSLGLYFAVRKDQKIERVAYVAAYIVGAEVLWRMARIDIFWEFGKYAAALIMIVALVRRQQWKLPAWPLIYLIFLVPACLLTIIGDGLSDAKDKLSFNMSGPFLLFVSCWFFSCLQINPVKLKRLLITITLPLISVAAISLFFTVTIENIEFGTESNFLTSGFFGPNQVSSMLGLGVFLCLTAYLLFRNNLKDTVFICFFAMLFAGQSVLTFSRGGMYNALGATIAVMLFQISDLRKGLKRVIPVLGLAAFFLLLAFPYLDDFTSGALQTRFEDTDTSGRLDIVEADLQIFANNPILGAGVGEARELREEYFGRAVGAHTEFTRIFAEHGLFGIFALLALTIGVISRLRKVQLNLSRALAMGAVVWSSLFMMGAGMRLAAPSFMWGLSFLTVLARSPSKKTQLSTWSINRPGSAGKFTSIKGDDLSKQA